MELLYTFALICPAAMSRREDGPVENEMLLVLVLEDDVLVQDMVRDAMSEGGFETQVVSSGEEAIQLLEAESAKHRALLTDINVRGSLSGWDVAKRARELNPDVPVIYMTGAAADEWPSRGVPNSVLLHKPFAPAQVVTALAQLLNQTPPPHA